MTEDDFRGRMATFDRFQFEISTGRLRKDGTRLRVEDKPARLLALLLDRAGTVVTREELQKLLWPDGVHVDFDHGLNKAVNKLRTVLGDDPEDPRFIETLPRLGYRFIGAVEIIENRREVPASAPAGPAVSGQGSAAAFDLPVPRTHRAHIPLYVLLGGVFLAVIVGLAASLLLPPRTGRFVRATLASLRRRRRTSEIHTLKIEKNGAIDPLDEGFKLHRPLESKFGQVLYNRETNGWDRWRIATYDQNYYYRALSAEEKDFALQRDWRLTCVCALESGGGEADIDFAGKGPRFDIELLQEGNRYFVALTKQISPKMEWEQKIEFPGVSDVDHPHTYELRYDHLTRTASLWIDSELRASGYPGHHQFQEDRGLLFGVAIYMDATRSSLVTRTVRFEAD